MGNIFNRGLKSVDITEGEYNNMLIDIWSAMNKKTPGNPLKYQYVDAATGEVVESDAPISVTITLKNTLL
jgi:hypothetical protein